MTEENDQPIDKFGFPSVEKKNNYYDNGTIVKLMSLRKYLEKYILGINCRITDVTGEGIIFERYNFITSTKAIFKFNLSRTNRIHI